MTEKDFEEKFITDLISSYGYPNEAIKRDVKIGTSIFDMAIQKGTIYIQAFEFKKKLVREISLIYQRFSEASVETPFYSVIFKDDGSWSMYEGDDFKKPIKDVKEILNYKKAISKFFRQAQFDIGGVINGLKNKCWICASVLALYFVYYLICSCGCCSCCCGLATDTQNLLSYDIILYLGLIIIIVLLPSIVQLIGVVRRVKIGLFELELKDKLEL